MIYIKIRLKPADLQYYYNVKWLLKAALEADQIKHRHFTRDIQSC